MNLIAKLADNIRDVVKSVFDYDCENVTLTFPPDIKFGDLMFGCFVLAKPLQKDPTEIAKMLAPEIAKIDGVADAVATGPYVNITLRSNTLFGSLVGDFKASSQVGKGKKVMVEYLSPNTNKPLHLGHTRNGCLGMSIALLLELGGYEVIKANLTNDRGVHICKSMIAWQRWGNGVTPEQAKIKPDHFVGDWYVRFNQEAEKNPELEKEAREMLIKWEQGDPEVLELWRKMNEWVYSGFAETYNKLGFQFDVFYYESNTYKLGKDIVDSGLKKGVLKRNKNNAIVAELPIEEFGAEINGQAKKATLLRADGTSVYLTQDLGTAKLKFDQYHLDRSICVVGSEQDNHFKTLFYLLKALGFQWAKECYHLSYGMVNLPHGKMKSRTGQVVDADDLVAGMVDLAANEIRARDTEHKLTQSEIARRAEAVGLGAIKYYLLSVAPTRDIKFDPEASISFEGNTGPYVMYAYARAASIIRNAQKEGIVGAEPDLSLLGTQEERLLAQKLIAFPEQVNTAIDELNPSIVTNALYEVAKAFNQFYHKCPVLGEEKSKAIARIELIKKTMMVIKMGLSLLGIEALDQM